MGQPVSSWVCSKFPCTLVYKIWNGILTNWQWTGMFFIGVYIYHNLALLDVRLASDKSSTGIVEKHGKWAWQQPIQPIKGRVGVAWHEFDITIAEQNSHGHWLRGAGRWVVHFSTQPSLSSRHVLCCVPHRGLSMDQALQDVYKTNGSLMAAYKHL